MALQKMAIPFSNTKLRVPQGFQNLLEGLAREVLRDQPKDIHSYSAKYFLNLLNKREYEGDPAERGASLNDRYYNDTSFQDPDIDPSDLTQQDAALKIQTKFRQHHAKHIVKTKREEKAATTIQAGYRGFLDRRRISDIKKTKQETRKAQDALIAAEPAANYVDPEDPNVNKAATAIQAGYKGYKARQEVKEIKKTKEEDEVGSTGPADDATVTSEPPKEQEEEVIDIDMNDPEVLAAATKIQASFKGYRVRKEHADKKTDDGEEEATEQDENVTQEAEDDAPKDD
jgi:hypothetical protein